MHPLYLENGEFLPVQNVAMGLTIILKRIPKVWGNSTARLKSGNSGSRLRLLLTLPKRSGANLLRGKPRGGGAAGRAAKGSADARGAKAGVARLPCVGISSARFKIASVRVWHESQR